MILNKIPKDKFLLIAGPCAIEGEEISIKIAEKLLSITSNYHSHLYLKVVIEKPTELDLIVLQVLVI